MDEVLMLVDQYIDKFLISDHTIIKIKDEKYLNMILKKKLQERIREREIRKMIAYVIRNTLFLEKL